MEEIILSLVIGVLIIISYTLGLKNGQRVVRGQEVELPKIEPIKAIQRHIEEREVNEEMERLNNIINNIENYSGDSSGQKEVI